MNGRPNSNMGNNEGYTKGEPIIVEPGNIFAEGKLVWCYLGDDWYSTDCDYSGDFTFTVLPIDEGFYDEDWED